MQKYLSLVKFSHTVFALPFALLGLTLGLSTQADLNWSWALEKLLWVLVCMVTARTAAMAFNRWLDRDIDAANPRTAIREIPAGKVRPAQALALTLGSAAVFVFASFQLNALCGWLSPVALVVILGYSYTKRFTPLCHLVLGLGLGLAPVGAYLAVTEAFAVVPVLLGFAVLTWVAGFDIIYALQDEAFDREKGLWSIPSVLGGPRALGVSRLLHSISFLLMAAVVYLLGAGLLGYLALGVYGTLLVRQQTLVTPTDLSRVNLAFFTLNGIASVVFGLLSIGDVVWRYWW